MKFIEAIKAAKGGKKINREQLIVAVLEVWQPMISGAVLGPATPQEGAEQLARKLGL